MPFDMKVITIILQEITEFPEKYDGYRADLAHLVSDILLTESEHLISRTNIISRVSDQINTVGMDLYRARKEECE